MALHYITTPNSAIVKRHDILTILVHGGALSSNMYRTLSPYLATPSLAIDLPGHGKSVDSGPFTFATSDKLMRNLITELRQKDEHKESQFVLVGVSLGGQAVLSFVAQYPELVAAAVVSGVSVHPPNDAASWEMPHMPTDQAWLDEIMKDVAVVGMEAASAIQAESFAFTLDQFQLPVAQKVPPILVCVGAQDTAMSIRDFDELVQRVKLMNEHSEGLVIKDAWHNHPIDIPREFANVIDNWIEKVFSTSA